MYFSILSPNVSVTVITHDVSLNTIIGNWTMLVTLGVIFYFLGQSSKWKKTSCPCSMSKYSECLRIPASASSTQSRNPKRARNDFLKFCRTSKRVESGGKKSVTLISVHDFTALGPSAVMSSFACLSSCLLDICSVICVTSDNFRCSRVASGIHTNMVFIADVIRRLFLPPQEPQRFPMFPPEEPFWNGNRRQ